MFTAQEQSPDNVCSQIMLRISLYLEVAMICQTKNIKLTPRALRGLRCAQSFVQMIVVETVSLVWIRTIALAPVPILDHPARHVKTLHISSVLATAFILISCVMDTRSVNMARIRMLQNVRLHGEKEKL